MPADLMKQDGASFSDSHDFEEGFGAIKLLRRRGPQAPTHHPPQSLVILSLERVRIHHGATS